MLLYLNKMSYDIYYVHFIEFYGPVIKVKSKYKMILDFKI